MLQIKEISKQYITGDLVQTALNKVNLNFRDNEFVAILGPSGSGKTTLLNIIGGLDQYDSGDLIINNISTQKYKDRDWDSYRNHTIGFVFQSYNLIPHQTILSNVELALTISGISKRERKERAKEALEKVGLGTQVHKKPSQLSGGQMQRVAIARALVNNPDILLADEPTGALDTETSIQVMDLLKEVAKDRLVIMVTHNPELAEEYATRIVKLKDGNIVGDTKPFPVNPEDSSKAVHKNMGKTSMKIKTALSLSFNNLRAKKGRTFLTAFAGSIGIIGIALILAFSNGVNEYIENIQRDTMASYPITIEAQSIDLSSIMGEEMMGGRIKEEVSHDLDSVYSNSSSLEMVNRLTSSFTENNLTEFKKYLDDENNKIREQLGKNGVKYSYDVVFDVYAKNADDTIIDTNTNAFSLKPETSSTPGALGQFQDSMRSMVPAGGMGSSETFGEMLPGTEGDLVSSVVKDSYDLLYGAWPQNYNEVVLVLDQNNEIPTTALYALGLIPTEQYDAIMESIESGEEFEVETFHYSYDEICRQEFYLIPACDYYVKNEDGTFHSIKGDKLKLETMLKDAIKLHVTGVIRPMEEAKNANITSAIGYTNALTDYIIDYANNSEIVAAQLANKDMNVLNGMEFAPEEDAARVADAKNYIEKLGVSDKAKLWSELAAKMYAGNPEQLQGIAGLGEVQLAAMADEYFASADDEIFLMLYDNYISVGSYDSNMSAFGFVSLDAPSSISIYADTFEAKEAIADFITEYNSSVEEAYQITYTDFVAIMTSSITTIINVISYVLIAFVAVSLIVSSIMIGIITYISVLERTKEIGILRAIGASKRNISQVFNAETGIVGLLSGTLGVGISCLILIPCNALLRSLLGTSEVNATLPVISAVILIALSVILTLIGGFIPAKKAARKDPVSALRSE
jgi:putative ABC transport system permease protein